jgi:hypothetical protein
VSDLQFYWTVTAPGILAGLQAVVWAWLWWTRRRERRASGAHKQLALNLHR